MPRPRILLDITTLLRATGHADGITRTLWHLSSYAAAHLQHIEFVCLDADKPQVVNRDVIDGLLSGTHKIDTSYLPDRTVKPRLRELLPAPLKAIALWIQRPRRQAFLLVEALILRQSRLAPIAERVRPYLINEKYRKLLTVSDGTIGRLVPRSIAMSDSSPFAREDTLILAGSNWIEMSFSMRHSNHPAAVVLCYDTIPLLFPQFFVPSFVAAYRQCFENVFCRADLVVFTAEQIRADTAALSEAAGHSPKSTAVIKLGSDLGALKKTIAPLRAPLEAGKFALFVSTFEPRKGHRTLFEIWKKLLDEGIPQAHGFKLVFVGRKGWMVDELIAAMRAHSSFGVSLIWFDNADDATLATLYDHCAFTLYPSLYEGFGLPIIESFRHGKAVIASGAGALRETVDGLSPTLNPTDESEWLATLRAWITSPDAYRRYERDIRERFETRSWSATAAEFFSLALAVPATSPQAASAQSSMPT